MPDGGGMSSLKMDLLTTVLSLIAFLLLPAAMLADQGNNPPMESPQSFVNRKLSNYRAGTDALRTSYEKFCRVPGQKFGLPPAVPPPQGVFVPGGIPQGQGPLPGGPQLVETPGLGGGFIIENVEIEQVINTWYAASKWGTGANPYSWNDVAKAFQPGSTSSSSSSSSSGGGLDNCTGKSIRLSGGLAYIVLNPSYKSCSLSTSSSGTAIYFSTLGKGTYTFAPQSWNGWSGTSGTDTYNTWSTGTYSKGGSTVTVTFTVTGSPYTLQVSSVNW